MIVAFIAAGWTANLIMTILIIWAVPRFPNDMADPTFRLGFTAVVVVPFGLISCLLAAAVARQSNGGWRSRRATRYVSFSVRSWTKCADLGMPTTGKIWTDIMRAHKFDDDDLKNRFTYHAPKQGQPERYNAVRLEYLAIARVISIECPPSPELSRALTKLEESVFWANAAIARNE